MFYNLLSKVIAAIYPCTIEEDFKVRGQKELRIIENIEPLLTNHKLVIDDTLIRKDAEMVQREPTKVVYLLIYQLTHLTRDKGSLTHDDRLDALAIACQYVKDMVMVDTDSIIEQAKQREMEKFLQEKIYGNYTHKNPSYISRY